MKLESAAARRPVTGAQVQLCNLKCQECKIVGAASPASLLHGHKHSLPDRTQLVSFQAAIGAQNNAESLWSCNKFASAAALNN